MSDGGLIAHGVLEGGPYCFCGSDRLEPFLRRTKILVCLLPTTPATRGIVNLDLLRKPKRNGALGGVRSEKCRHPTFASFAWRQS